eukprot:Hpha_TRINITY_DN15086_c0_g1::TRINITY_DN15086_c0_g1_i1::g.123534::m.123534
MPRGKKTDPSEDWHSGDKVFRSEHKHFEVRPPTSLCSAQAEKREYSEKNPFKTVPNREKKIDSIDGWHSQNMKVIEQAPKAQVGTRADKAPIEQPKKRQLDLQHWNKALQRREPPAARGGWVSDGKGSHEVHFSTVSKVVQGDPPHRFQYEVPPVETRSPSRRTAQ